MNDDTNLEHDTYYYSDSILHAIDKNNTKDLIYLINWGKDVNKNWEGGYTALIQAVLLNRIECVAILLQPDVKVNIYIRDYEGNTALMFAAKKNHIDCVKLLLKNRAKGINLKNRAGQTALIIAKKQNHNEIVTLLENT